MVVQLVGVVLDGSPWGAKVPRNTRRELHMPKGGSLTLVLDVMTQSGMAYDLTGKTVTLTVKRSSQQVVPPPGFAKAFIQDTRIKSRTSATIVPADSKFMEPARYVYDVWVIASPTSRDVVIPLSPFVIEAAVTLP